MWSQSGYTALDDHFPPQRAFDRLRQRGWLSLSKPATMTQAQGSAQSYKSTIYRIYTTRKIVL
jgi:hypothetical protein